MYQLRPFLCPITETSCTDSGCKRGKCLAKATEDQRREEAEAPAKLERYRLKKLYEDLCIDVPDRLR
jgi:hypothetical protein